MDIHAYWAQFRATNIKEFTLREIDADGKVIRQQTAASAEDVLTWSQEDQQQFIDCVIARRAHRECQK